MRTISNGRHFHSDRTDDGQSLHIEDFAQVFGVYPLAKYEKASYRNLARVVAAESGDDDIAESIRRVTGIL